MTNTLLCFFAIILLSTSCKKEQNVALDLEMSPEQLEIFGKNLISTPLYERDIAISPDGNQIVYTLGNYQQSLRALVSIKKEGSKWGQKEILPFSGKYNDIEPFFSVDGDKLYFASNRPVDKDSTRTDYNIWYSEKGKGVWKDPIAIDTIVNSLQDEFYPSVSTNGNLYFTSTRTNGIGREDIFVSTFTDKVYNTPIALDSTINTKFFEFNAYINPEEDLLIFSSYGRSDGLGGGDLYYSKKDNAGKWKKAKNLGELINSDKLDYCPFIDLPRNNFYFTSNREKLAEEGIRTVNEFTKEANKVLNGMGNIYRIPMDKLNLE